MFIYLFLEQINTDDNVTAIVVLWSRFLNFWDKQSTYHLDYKLCQLKGYSTCCFAMSYWSCAGFQRGKDLIKASFSLSTKCCWPLHLQCLTGKSPKNGQEQMRSKNRRLCLNEYIKGWTLSAKSPQSKCYQFESHLIPRRTISTHSHYI